MNRIRTDVFKGLHKRDGAPEGAFLEVSGISTVDYPTMKVRAPRSRYGEWENATDVYETDGHMVVIDDNKLYYDDKFLSNVSNQKKQFAEINRKLVIWPDKIYINLNTGELGNIEATISGTVSMREGGILTITASSGKGKKTYEHVGGTYYEVSADNFLVPQRYQNIYFRTYSNLSYSNGWVYSSASTGGIGVGSYFIGSAPQTSWNQSETNWDMGGTVYGKVTKITEVVHESTGIIPDLPDQNDTYWYDWTVEYELYDAAGVDLTKTFLAGDIVSVSGNALEYNNQEAVSITDVGKNQLVVEASFVEAAKYYNVESALPVGTYLFRTRIDPVMGLSPGIVFRTGRAIRAGEQLFVISDARDTGLPEDVVCAFDPQTRVLESFETVSSTSYTTLAAENNNYTASNAQAMAISRKVPDMEYICEHNNRLYGVTNNEEEKIFNTQTGQYETVTSRVLHASALGQPTRWNVFEGAATDSYAVTVAGEGDFTGIISYSGNVIAFKESKMYKLSGDYPAEFYLRSYTVDGVKKGCHKTMVIINEVLYFLSPYGVMSYSGGVPNLVSYELGIDQYGEAVAGRDRTNYLIQMDELYCYDTIHGLWVSEDYGNVTGIEAIGNKAYIVTDGKIMMTDSGDEAVEWYATTHYTDEGTFLHKDYQTMNLDVSVAEGAQMKVEYRTREDEGWKELFAVTNYHGVGWQERTMFNEAVRKHLQFNPGIHRADGIQLKLSGKGMCKIYAYDRVFRAESDRP